MKFLKAALILGLIFPVTAKAGGSSGGTPPAMQLDLMALSERVLDKVELAKLSGSSFDERNSLKSFSTMSRRVLMESLEPIGVMLEVTNSDFESIADGAESGNVIFYHEAETIVSAVNRDSNTLILRMVDDPSVVVVVQQPSVP